MSLIFIIPFHTIFCLLYKFQERKKIVVVGTWQSRSNSKITSEISGFCQQNGKNTRDWCLNSFFFCRNSNWIIMFCRRRDNWILFNTKKTIFRKIYYRNLLNPFYLDISIEYSILLNSIDSISISWWIFNSSVVISILTLTWNLMKFDLFSLSLSVRIFKKFDILVL